MTDAEERVALLDSVQQSIGDKVCKAYDYDRIGKPSDRLYYEIIVLRNLEFYLCNGEPDCDTIDCLRCKYSYVK